MWHPRYQNGFGSTDVATVVGTEVVPGNISFPSDADYTASLIDAVDAVSDVATVSFDRGGEFDPPFMNQIGVLKATIESTTGVPFSHLARLATDVFQLTQATNPSEVVAAVSNLMGDSLQTIVVALEAAGVASEAIDAIPIIGQIVGVIMGGILQALEFEAARKQAKIDCRARAFNDARALCSKEVAAARVQATSVEGVQPGDMFRPILYAMQRKDRLPIAPASMYVALCGGETQGAFHAFSRQSWAAFVDDYRKRTGKHHIGIPVNTQRRMWKLCKGIMGSARDPRIGVLTETGDNGRSLMPLLQDIVWNLYRVGTGMAPKRGVFGIDKPFLQAVSAHVTGAYEQHTRCSDLPSLPSARVDCSKIVDLSSSLDGSIKQFELGLKHLKLLQPDGSWSATPPREIIEQSIATKPPSKGLLILTGRAANTLSETALAAEEAAKETQKRVDDRKAAMWTTAVVLGGGSFMLARRAAKRRR